MLLVQGAEECDDLGGFSEPHFIGQNPVQPGDRRVFEMRGEEGRGEGGVRREGKRGEDGRGELRGKGKRGEREEMLRRWITKRVSF